MQNATKHIHIGLDSPLFQFYMQDLYSVFYKCAVTIGCIYRWLWQRLQQCFPTLFGLVTPFWHLFFFFLQLVFEHVCYCEQIQSSQDKCTKWQLYFLWSGWLYSQGWKCKCLLSKQSVMRNSEEKKILQHHWPQWTIIRIKAFCEACKVYRLHSMFHI